MPACSSNKKRPSDTNLFANFIVATATGEDTEAARPEDGGKNPAAVIMGRLGSKKEPYDDELPVEWPRLLRKAFHATAERNPSSPISLVERLEIDDSDVVELASLTEDFFDRLLAGDNMIRFRPVPSHPKLRGSYPNNIVDFE